MKKSLIPALAVLVMTACGTVDPEKQIDALYQKMTPTERLAQLQSIYLNQFFKPDGSLDTLKCRELIPDGIGHFSQYASQLSWEADQTRDRVAIMQDWLIHNTPNGIPALFHEEALTGVCTRDATVYPQQIGQACSFNTALAELKTVQTGTAMRKIGGLLALSPMVDVVRTPSFPRLEESYGEDAYLSAEFGTAFVRGLQQGDLRVGVGATSKHFLGYGGGGDAPEKELMEEILLPHETMIRLAGSKSLMTGYHEVHGVDAVMSSELMQDILRNYLGYDGMMVSDYGSINQIMDFDNNLERGAAAINAGNDVDFPIGQSYSHLYEAIEKGLVSEATFENAVKSVLRYKQRVGLLDENPKLYAEGHIEFDSSAERQTAYDIASQSIVMLKNDGVLPLGGQKKVLLTGPNANTMWAMLGDYTFNAMRFFWQRQLESDMTPRIVNLKDGMEARRPEGIEVSYTRGCDWTELAETKIQAGGDERVIREERRVPHPEVADEKAALKLAADADVIVAAVGENVLLCGENRERASLKLPGRQEEFVNRLIATGKPVVLVVFGGRAQVIADLSEKCAAVIQAWYPGEEGGNAVADILYGHVNPSAKLSVSYPNTEIFDEPVCYNYQTEKDPRIQWEFGYGLSYTSYSYSGLQMAQSASTSDKGIELSFEVKNDGEMTGDEIVQIYLSPVSGDQNIRPIQLQGFGRVSLAPGESKRMSCTLSPEQFGFYADKQWNIAPGRFIVKVGASSQDIRLQQEIELTGKPVTKNLREVYFSKTVTD